MSRDVNDLFFTLYGTLERKEMEKKENKIPILYILISLTL